MLSGRTLDQTLAAIAAALDRRDASPLPLGEG
jgi:hypothetical protein